MGVFKKAKDFLAPLPKGVRWSPEPMTSMRAREERYYTEDQKFSAEKFHDGWELKKEDKTVKKVSDRGTAKNWVINKQR